MPNLEQQFCQPCDENDEEQQMMRFHDFLHFSRCTKHGDLDNQAKSCKFCDKENNPKKKKAGKFSRRKRLTSLLKSFGEFINNFHLKNLEKCSHHRPHFILLGKNQTGNDRKSKIEPGQVHTERDYADAFTFKCNNEIQQEHFGDSRNLSMEVVCCFLSPKGQWNCILKEDLKISQSKTRNMFSTAIFLGTPLRMLPPHAVTRNN